MLDGPAPPLLRRPVERPDPVVRRESQEVRGEIPVAGFCRPEQGRGPVRCWASGIEAGGEQLLDYRLVAPLGGHHQQRLAPG